MGTRAKQIGPRVRPLVEHVTVVRIGSIIVTRAHVRAREHERELVQGNRTFALIDTIEFDTEL